MDDDDDGDFRYLDHWANWENYYARNVTHNIIIKPKIKLMIRRDLNARRKGWSVYRLDGSLSATLLLQLLFDANIAKQRDIKTAHRLHLDSLQLSRATYLQYDISMLRHTPIKK